MKAKRWLFGIAEWIKWGLAALVMMPGIVGAELRGVHAGALVFALEPLATEQLTDFAIDLRKIVVYRVTSPDKPLVQVGAAVAPESVHGIVTDPAQRYVIADVGSKLLIFEFLSDRGSLEFRNAIDRPKLWPERSIGRPRVVFHPNGRFAYYTRDEHQGELLLIAGVANKEVGKRGEGQRRTSKIGIIALVPGVGGKPLEPQTVATRGSLSVDPHGRFLLVTEYRQDTGKIVVTAYRVDPESGELTQSTVSELDHPGCAKGAEAPIRSGPMDERIAWSVFGSSGRVVHFFRGDAECRSSGRNLIITGKFDSTTGKVVQSANTTTELWITDLVVEEKNSLVLALSRVAPDAEEVVTFRDDGTVGGLIKVSSALQKRSSYGVQLPNVSGEIVDIVDRDDGSGKGLVSVSARAIAQGSASRLTLPFRCSKSESGWCLRDRLDAGVAVTLLGDSSGKVCTAKTRAREELPMGGRISANSLFYTPIELSGNCSATENYFLATLNIMVNSYELATVQRVEDDATIKQLDSQARQSGVFELARSKHSRRLEKLHGYWSLPATLPEVRRVRFSHGTDHYLTWSNGACDQPSVFVSGGAASFVTTLFGRDNGVWPSSLTVLAINEGKYAVVVGSACGGNDSSAMLAVVYRLGVSEARPVYVNRNWRFDDGATTGH